MVGAINAPTTGNTLDAFIQLAKNATESTSPPFGPVGGILSTLSNSTSTPSNSTSIPSSAPPQITSNSASELSVQLLGVAAAGLGALAML
jgi:hypothetical protein